MQALISNPRVIQIVCEKNLKQISVYKGYLKIVFGRYHQVPKSDITDIEWLVLRSEGSKVLLISKDALDCRKYSENSTETTWETCSLRNWLNDSLAIFNSVVEIYKPLIKESHTSTLMALA